MGILNSIGNFLFGKNPDIFDINGNVSHKHPEKKWSQWKGKYKSDPSLNWRHHSGMQAGTDSAATLQNKSSQKPNA